MRAPNLRLVPATTPSIALTPAERIEAAFERMMAEARNMRIAAESLARSARRIFDSAGQIEKTVPLFAEAEQRLLVERDRAYEIANDAALIERRILQSSPGNLGALTSGLPGRLQTDAVKTHAA